MLPGLAAGEIKSSSAGGHSVRWRLGIATTDRWCEMLIGFIVGFIAAFVVFDIFQVYFW